MAAKCTVKFQRDSLGGGAAILMYRGRSLNYISMPAGARYTLAQTRAIKNKLMQGCDELVHSHKVGMRRYRREFRDGAPAAAAPAPAPAAPAPAAKPVAGAAKRFCVDAGSPRLDACFAKKESAFQYARTVSRLEGKSVRADGVAPGRQVSTRAAAGRCPAAPSKESVMAKRARACAFTAPWGSREIYKDGKPFITIKRPTDKDGNGPSPTDVDSTARRILKLLCGGR